MNRKLIAKIIRLHKYISFLEGCMRVTFENNPDCPSAMKQKARAMRKELIMKGDLSHPEIWEI